ncbi:hypothetical protein A6U87_12670 [Rhizobium sp. AC44/96]|uniref:hypothetical protein n=1 Tax=Rhizobium sp. AC44/96 TaxID=1841654 RepID=UPI00080F8677|nr:hypothetical protein [Rhizobium sp. AC44/96]OCJ08098.1 hypothetical protein A6U87_12670 [Rhizobium sp. AC44/96]
MFARINSVLIADKNRRTLADDLSQEETGIPGGRLRLHIGDRRREGIFETMSMAENLLSGLLAAEHEKAWTIDSKDHY